MPGDADAAPAFALTPPEEQLLVLIRDGRVDAEIAVRLAISNAEVKERIERLAAKLGVKGRAELRDAALAPPGPLPEAPEAPWEDVNQSGRWRVPVAVTIGVLIGIGATWFAMRRDEGAATGRQLAASQIRTSVAGLSDGTLVAAPTFARAATPSPTPTARATTISGRRMLDAGQLLEQPGHAVAVASSEARESLVVVTLTDASAFVFDNGFANWRLSPDSSSPKYLPVFVGSLGETGYTLHFTSADPGTHFLPGDSNSIGIYSQGDAPPAVVLWVDGHHTEVGVDGHLYIDPAPLARSAVVTFDTGELLDVSRATPLGKVDGAWTRCGYAMRACDVISRPDSRSGPAVVPMDGILHCREDGVLELAAADFTLLFNQLSPSGPEMPGCEPLFPEPVRLKAGGMLSNPRHYRIEAFTPTGAPLSVVVAGDGTLYVGDIPRKFGCPCRGGT